MLSHMKDDLVFAEANTKALSEKIDKLIEDGQNVIAKRTTFNGVTAYLETFDENVFDTQRSLHDNYLNIDKDFAAILHEANEHLYQNRTPAVIPKQIKEIDPKAGN